MARYIYWPDLRASTQTDTPVYFANGTTTSNVPYINYKDRGKLRTGSNTSGDLSFVESLGLYRFYRDIIQIDDDEYSIVQGSIGTWLLECPHWDFIKSNILSENSIQNSKISALESKTITGTISNTITTLSALSQTTLTATVVGARVGYSVCITPDANLSAGISLYARVSSTDTVTVIINNSSASASALTAGTWTLTVFKS